MQRREERTLAAVEKVWYMYRQPQAKPSDTPPGSQLSRIRPQRHTTGTSIGRAEVAWGVLRSVQS